MLDPIDPDRPVPRMRDTEVKGLAYADELIVQQSELFGFNIHEAEINIEIFSTFEPCDVCKREILARTTIFKKLKVQVYNPYFIDLDGAPKPVTGTAQFYTLK